MELGQIVLSKCGRDKSRYFIVVSIDENKEYVYLSDGDLRKMEKPKKKKIKHIVPLHIDETLKSKLISGERVTNPEIKRHLRSVIEEIIDISFNDSITDYEGGKYHG